MKLSTIFGILLLIKTNCHAQPETNHIGLDENDSDGLMLRLGDRMQTKLASGANARSAGTTGTSAFGGMYYDEDGRLVINQKGSVRSKKALFDEARNATVSAATAAAYKEAILDLYGAPALLSQLDPERADSIMDGAEVKARRLQSGAPPSGEDIDGAAKATIASDHMNEIDIRFKTVRFSFRELHDDYGRLLKALFKNKRVLEADLDEVRNRIVVVVASKATKKFVRRTASRLKISHKKIIVEVRPGEAAELDVGEEVAREGGADAPFANGTATTARALQSGSTLMDRSRPIRGGLFIEIPVPYKTQNGCTVGFVAKRVVDGKIGFVTASHCTEYQGELDGSVAYQTNFGTVPPPSSDRIGVEWSEAVPDSSLNTYSDSAFFKFDDSFRDWTTAIHKTEGNGSNVKRTRRYTTWYSLRIGTNSVAGENIYKVGRNTGQTRGTVVQTCVQVNGIGDTNKRCQDKVNTRDPGIFFQWKGDSGAAAIFTYSPTSRFAWIRGISWGRRGKGGFFPEEKPNLPLSTPGCFDYLDDGTCWQIPPEGWDHFVSPISNVEQDHGKLLTHYNDVRYDPPAPAWCNLLSKSDSELYNIGLTGTIGKYCKVQTSTSGACSHYVKGKPRNSGYDGIPLTSGSLLGTGCVRSVPYGGYCYYRDSRYPLTTAERNSMCTNSVVANSAAQLRFGMRNGYCEDNQFAKCP